MNANTIAALLRLQTPLALYQQQREAADAALRQAIADAGFDLGVLEAAHEEYRLDLPPYDSGLSAVEPDQPAECSAAAVWIGTLKRQESRIIRLVAIARALRTERNEIRAERDAIATGAFATERERSGLADQLRHLGESVTRANAALDRWRTEAETAHGNEERLNKALRQSEDMVSIRTGQRDDALGELAEARAKLETAQSEGLRLAGYLDLLYPNGWSAQDFEGPVLVLPASHAPAETSPAVEPEPVAPAPEPEPVAAPVAMCPGVDSAGCPHELPVAFPISGLCRRCQGKKNRAGGFGAALARVPGAPAPTPKPAPTPQPKAVTPASTTGAFTIDAGGVPHTSTSILACVRTAMHKRAWFRLAIDENGPVALALGKGGDAWLKPLCDITPEETGWCCTVPPTGVTRHPAADRVTKWLDGIVGKAARRSND